MSRVSICVKGKILRGTTKESSKYATINSWDRKKRSVKNALPKRQATRIL